MTADPPPRRTSRAAELAIVVGILQVTAGIVLPVLRSSRIRTDSETARQDLIEIRTAVQQFLQDTGVGPTRGRNGQDRVLCRLVGPGRSTTPPTR